MEAKRVVCLVAIMCFLSLSIQEAQALPIGNASFQGAGVAIDLEFPEEAHPTETITLNLTMTALTGLKIQNLTLVVEVLVDTGWQQAYKEQVVSLSMMQNDTLDRMVWFTLPLNAREALRCYMYVLTDKTPGFPLVYVFYTSRVRTLTYDELLANYTSLQAENEALVESSNTISAQYNALNSTYYSLLNQYDSLNATFESLNGSYFVQKADFEALNASYDSLEADYRTLNQTYYGLTDENEELSNTVNARDAELAVAKNVAYALIVVVVALVALVIYVKKISSEPYVVVRKETVSLKPD